jgi:hypothetical protein
MCALIVGALRGSYLLDGDFDAAMMLNHPRREDLKIVLRAGKGPEKDSEPGWTNQHDEIETIQVEMTNVEAAIPPGELLALAMPGEPPRSNSESLRGCEVLTH